MAPIMVDIWDVVAEVALALHPERVKAIADKIGSLQSSSEFASAKSAFANIGAPLVERRNLTAEGQKS